MMPTFVVFAFVRLELLFLGQMRWDMSISSSLYAKYYFALRSLAEKKDFRRRYNQVMKVNGEPFVCIRYPLPSVVSSVVINVPTI